MRFGGRYGEIQVGDYVRPVNDPTFREVLYKTTTPDGYVFVEIGIGSMVEKLPPVWRMTPIEIERGDE